MTTTFSPAPRIALFLFAHFLSVGAWYVSLGVYMSKGLGFDHIIGAAYGMTGVASMVSSLIGGMIADRYFPAQRMLGVLQLCAGASLLWVSTIQHSEALFLAGVGIHYVFVGATAPVAIAIAFWHLPNAERQLPVVRAAGTVGWIVAGLVIGLWQGSAITPGPMRLAAAVYVLAGLYAFTLPHTPPTAKAEPMNIVRLFGLDILRSIRSRVLWVFIACLVAVAIPKKFYDSLLNNFLLEKGVTLQAFGVVLESTGVQTIGQIVEAMTLLALPWVIARLGIKWVMVLGMAAWVLRFLLFANGFDGGTAILWMVLLGIFIHGLCYDFFFISGQIWFDKQFDPSMRTRAQALFSFLLNGIGVTIGANIAGAVYRLNTVAPGQRDWMSIWLVPAAVTFVVMLVFISLFKESRRSAAPQVA